MRQSQREKAWKKTHMPGKSDSKRGKYQWILPTIGVDEDLRFPPQIDHTSTVRCFLYACYGNPKELDRKPSPYSARASSRPSRHKGA